MSGHGDRRLSAFRCPGQCCRRTVVAVSRPRIVAAEAYRRRRGRPRPAARPLSRPSGGPDNVADESDGLSRPGRSSGRDVVSAAFSGQLAAEQRAVGQTGETVVGDLVPEPSSERRFSRSKRRLPRRCTSGEIGADQHGGEDDAVGVQCAAQRAGDQRSATATMPVRQPLLSRVGVCTIRSEPHCARTASGQDAEPAYDRCAARRRRSLRTAITATRPREPAPRSAQRDPRDRPKGVGTLLMPQMAA